MTLKVERMIKFFCELCKKNEMTFLQYFFINFRVCDKCTKKCEDILANRKGGKDE